MDKRSTSTSSLTVLDRSPTCCELVTPRIAVVVTAALQTFLLSAFICAFLWMRSEGFFYDNSPLRYIITVICALYLLCIACTLIGAVTSVPSALSLSSALLLTFIVLTDLIAIAVVVCMAIGNRNEWLHSLPGHLVVESRFERTLGPFWMYLSAISLHITVAANMCFLQSVNHYIKTIGLEAETASQQLDNQDESKY